MSDLIEVLRGASKFAKSTGKHSLSAFGMADLLDAAATRIADLEAQLDALCNPQYTPVAEAAPDGDDDAKAAREMDDEELNALVQNMIDYPDSEIDTAVWPAKEYILTEYQRRHPAPTDPRPDCTLCGGDGINKAGSASCPACNGSGYANEPALEATATETDDIVTRLDAADVFHEPTGALIRAAAAEIRRLRALITPRVDITPMYDIWGCKGKVYLGNMKVFETDWYTDKDRAREGAQTFAYLLTAELKQR